jgi:meckelin
MFQVSVGVLSALAVVWSGIETWSYSRRSGRVGIDHVTLVKLLIFSCGNLANVFFFVMACASFHTFTFYKGQSIVHVLLPSHRQEQLIRSYVISAFSLKVSLSCTGHKCHVK